MEVEIIKGAKIPTKKFGFINAERVRQYGKKTNLLSKKCHKESNFFFVKDKENILAFGFLRPVEMTYKNQKYNIFALGGIMVVEEEKGKGCGTILIQNMINYSKKTKKSILGFCGKEVVKFYKKAGLKNKENFNLQIEMENPKTGERVRDVSKTCSGIYFEGEDKFISKVIKNEGIATYWMPDIKEPHF